MNGSGRAATPIPKAGADWTDQRAGAEHPGACDRPRHEAAVLATAPRWRALDLHRAVECSPWPLDLDRPIDRPRPALDLDLTLDRSTARARDGRVTFHGLSARRRDGHQAQHPENPGREEIPPPVHGTPFPSL